MELMLAILDFLGVVNLDGIANETTPDCWDKFQIGFAVAAIVYLRIRTTRGGVAS